MHLSTEAIVVAVRPHGEHGAIVRALTPEDGVRAGYIRGGRSRRLRPVLVPGNRIQADYRARTADQLPHLTAELVHSRAFLLSEPLASGGIEWGCALTAAALPLTNPRTELIRNTETWQDEAWGFYDDLGDRQMCPMTANSGQRPLAGSASRTSASRGRRPPGGAAQLEEGIKKHMAWHRAAGDTGSWHVWNIATGAIRSLLAQPESPRDREQPLRQLTFGLPLHREEIEAAEARVGIPSTCVTG